jgi:hypothetical protein
MDKRGKLDWLDTQPGHIIVSFLVFVIGLVSLHWRPEGKTVMEGGLVALWASLRNSQGAGSR